LTEAILVPAASVSALIEVASIPRSPNSLIAVAIRNRDVAVAAGRDAGRAEIVVDLREPDHRSYRAARATAVMAVIAARVATGLSPGVHHLHQVMNSLMSLRVKGLT
jgi:hypothetical protein